MTVSTQVTLPELNVKIRQQTRSHVDHSSCRAVSVSIGCHRLQSCCPHQYEYPQPCLKEYFIWRCWQLRWCWTWPSHCGTNQEVVRKVPALKTLRTLLNIQWRKIHAKPRVPNYYREKRQKYLCELPFCDQCFALYLHVVHELIYWTPTVNTLLGRVGGIFEQSVNATLLTVQDRSGKLIFKYYLSSTKLPSANHLSSRATCKHWTVPLRHLVITGRAALNRPVKFNNRGGATKYPSRRTATCSQKDISSLGQNCISHACFLCH